MRQNIATRPSLPLTSGVARLGRQTRRYKMTRFSGKETDILIEMIKERPALYDTSHKFYKDDYTRDILWKSIAEVLMKSDSECRKKWKLLKDSYNRFKRKRLCSKRPQIPPKNSKWQLFQRFKFLEDANSPGAVDTEVEDGPSLFEFSPSQSVTPTVNKEELKTSMISTTETLSTKQQNSDEANSTAIKRKKIKRKRKTSEEDDNLKQIKEREESRPVPIQQGTHIAAVAAQQQPLDDVASFSSYIALSLRKLSPRSKSMAKSEIFNIITKYEIKDINKQIATDPISVGNESLYFPKTESNSSLEDSD